MQYILSTTVFEELRNQQNWNSLQELGIDESYLMAVMISHLRLNGQIELDGSISVPGHISLEHEINNGSLQYFRDDLRERFLYSRTKLPIKIMVSSLARFVSLLYMSVCNPLMEMFKTLRLQQKFQLAGIEVRVIAKVYNGLAVDISYQPNQIARGFHYA